MMKNHYNDVEFLSVIIPAYNRFNYLKECIESIHKYADTPFEIIIHDDNSNDGTREKILSPTSELKNKVSSIILNNGLQLGLAESINRAVKIAGSNYIIMLNADCTIEFPIFKDVINTLKCPFVGSISLMSTINNKRATFISDNKNNNNENTKFQLIRGLGAGCAQAFTKDTFEKIGGWYSHIVDSSNADVSFMVRIIKNGYFIVALNTENNVDPSKFPVKNLSMEREKNSDSTIARGYHDCSYPRLFNLEKSRYLKMFDVYKSKYPMLDHRVGEDIYASLSRKRYENATDNMQITYREPGGDTNIDYWHHHMEKVIKEDYSIDIEYAKKCNHDKWIDDFERYKLNRNI